MSASDAVGRLLHPAHKCHGFIIAAHFRAQLIERQVRYLLPDHLERHPDGALAALAADPGVTFGLKLGDGATFGHCDFRRWLARLVRGLD